MAVRIVPVERHADLRTFVDFPWKIYRSDSNWIPPLKKSVLRLLDKEQHPFWKFSDQLLLLAYQGSELVGRIAGIIDRNYNAFHKTGMGIWGFFECVNDVEVARELFARVEQWVCDHGMTFLRGPLNPSTNYELGMLCGGYEHRPTFMMPYNPPYYNDLVEAAGFRKEKDLVSFIVDSSWRPPEWTQRLAQRIKEERHLTIRCADPDQIEREVAIIKAVYDDSWNQNWGYVPMTDDEAMEMARNLKMIADPELISFIYYKDEPVAVTLVVPDINPLLKHLKGKTGLLGPLRYLLHRKEINGMRGLLFGIKQKYRQLGLPFVALDHLFQAVMKSQRYFYLELGWNLEDNDAINMLEKEGGAKPFKHYRIYRKSFADRW